MNLNQHVENYLDYYIRLPLSPEYAVLLRGAWGSGKTFLIKNYLKNNSDLKHLYVSLNGVSSFKEIEDQFFEQLHPKLSSKGMKIAGKVLKGFLKTAIKVDLDQNGSSETTLNYSFPEINIPGYLTNTENHILIFDDLERCNMKISAILGYINQFVERDGMKVIILGNEEQILKHEEISSKGAEKYEEIKEKIIGKSFLIQSDPALAFDVFASELTETRVTEFLTEEKDLILQVYQSAGYENLRHLRQSLLDWERLFKFFSYKVKCNKEVLRHILQMVLAISFEIKKEQLRKTR